ncbi:MAG: glycosyl transferase, family 2 [Acidobacteria bacterium]|nr:glycosyl transferase, family 2 [Acidobacteriota bacterium]
MIRQPGRPFISIVIPNFNGAACLGPCLQSLMLQTYQDMEVLVVDNASRDRSLDIVRNVAPSARILCQEQNLGFAAAVNRGVAEARGGWVAILNNDTEAAEDWLAECVAAIGRHPDASYLACRILEHRDRSRIYSAGDCFLRAGIGYRRGQELPDCADYQREGPIFSACGCAALYRKTALQEAGGYDERFFAYLEDVDLGLRFQAAGKRGYYVPGARVLHIGGATSGGEFSALAVRLRTRNSILLLLKSLPGRILWRCLPMILAAQASWLARAVGRGRLLSYLRGLAGTLPLARGILEDRRMLRLAWQSSAAEMWHSILASEAMARRDFASDKQHTSRFLRWYFRLF